MKPNEFFSLQALVSMGQLMDQDRNVRYETLSVAVTAVQSAWNQRMPHLTCFLLSKFKKQRVLSLTVDSLLLIQVSVDDNARSANLDVNWQGRIPEPKEDKKSKTVGWGDIKPVVPPWQKAKQVPLYKTKMTFHLQKINSLRLYDWGYEFKTSGPIDMVAVLNSCIEENKDAFSGTIGNIWEIPFRAGQYADPNRMIPRGVWDIFGEEEADISDLLAEETKSLPDHGQRKRGLDFE